MSWSHWRSYQQYEREFVREMEAERHREWQGFPVVPDSNMIQGTVGVGYDPITVSSTQNVTMSFNVETTAEQIRSLGHQIESLSRNTRSARRSFRRLNNQWRVDATNWHDYPAPSSWHYTPSTQTGYHPVNYVVPNEQQFTVQWVGDGDDYPSVYEPTWTTNRVYVPRHPVPHQQIQRVSNEVLDHVSFGMDGIVAELGERLQAEYQRQEGRPVPESGVWWTWVRELGDDLDQTEVGVGYVNDTPDRAERFWRQWSAQAVPVAVAAGRPRRPTPEEEAAAAQQRERMEAARRQREEDARRRQQERQEDERRAEELLRSVLTTEQRADWERANHFELVAESGQRYRICRGYQGNVYLVDRRGRRTHSFCIHGNGSMPEADQCLNQKLLLETDEARFLEVANRQRVLAA